MTPEELEEMQHIGFILEIERILEEVERVHGMAVDRETVIANLEKVA